MPVSKFRFVSPGVQTAEIDNSQLPKLPQDMGPVVIGRALRGPLMRPVRINSFADFVDVFGEPVPGGAGGDIWRDGNRLTPTYAVYAAQAWLKNASPLTFVRLGGYENKYKITNAGEAGWKVNNAYGLFVAPCVSGALGPNEWKINGTASLAAIIYASGSAGLVGSGLATANADDVTGALGVWVRCDDPGAETRIVLNGVTSSINFDEDSKKYIRKVLNTNPTAYNDLTKKYFLGETYAYALSANGIDLDADKNDTATNALVLVKLKNYADFREAAQDSETGWIVSQHLGVTSSFTVDDTTGEYPELQKLFKVVSLTEGEWANQNLKISIDNIKLPVNEYVKYGTFTLSIRKAGDSDVRPEYLERFSGLTLDPNSDSFIAKRIGDKYTEWDDDKQAFLEYGTYDNASKFVRIEMNEDVEQGKTNPALLPFGYYGRAVHNSIAVSGTLATITGSSNFLQGTVSGATAFTASFAVPQIPLLVSSSNSPVSSLSAVCWGVQTTLNNSRTANPDYSDYVRILSVDFTGTKAQYLFTLDDVSGTVSNNIISEGSGAVWAQGNRLAGKSITANNGIDVLLNKFNKFTVPLVGGSDGVNVLQKDPFANENLGGNATDNYAYNSVKVAISSITDPEVVEMNLAAMPGITKSGLNSLLIEKCELRGDALAIVDLEGDYNPEKTAVKDRKPSVDSVLLEIDNYANTSYGCAFFPWVLVRDQINSAKVWVPPSVVALGTMASSQKKTEVWFAPAGFNRGGLSDGAAGLPVLQTSMRLSSKDRDDLYEKNINPIATFPAEGIVIFGQKTLQVTPSALDRINVRRLMIYLKKEISRMASSVLFDPNIKVTWNRFLDMANPFLGSVQSRFGLSEYRVILDETTTTPDLVDRNIVYAKILLKPTRAIEFIALDFVITNTGASFAD